MDGGGRARSIIIQHGTTQSLIAICSYSNMIYLYVFLTVRLWTSLPLYSLFTGIFSSLLKSDTISYPICILSTKLERRSWGLGLCLTLNSSEPLKLEPIAIFLRD